MGTLPAETLVVEDSLHCIETAKKAGFITAGVYEKSSEPDRNKIVEISDYYIDSLERIKEIICV